MRVNPIIRDVIISVCMISAALFVWLNPAEKVEPDKRIYLSSFIPEALYNWRSQTIDTPDYSDKWQSINELLVRLYYKRDGKNLLHILEYSSDLRQNFSFHFPENCNRASGNEIEFLTPLEIELDGDKVLKAKFLFVKGIENSAEPNDKFVAYWLVIDKKQYYRTFWIKIDQMLSGLLKQSKSGFLFRVDYMDRVKYDDESKDRAKALIREFVSDLYSEIDKDKRSLLFGI